MPTRVPATYILAALLLLLGGAASAQCPEGKKVFVISSGNLEGDVTLENSFGDATIVVNLSSPCVVELHGSGIVTDVFIQISGANVSMLSSCDGPLTITLTDPCGEGKIYDDILLEDPPGAAGGGGGDDDDDGGGGDGDGAGDGDGGGDGDGDSGSGDGDGSGSGLDELDTRSELGATRPPAKLVDIDVEVNPTVIEIDDLGVDRDERGIAANRIFHVTVTARLVFSDGTVSEDFSHCVENWQCWPQREDGERTNQEFWVDSMKEDANLQLHDPRERLALSCENEELQFTSDEPINLHFKVVKQLRSPRVQSKSVSIQVVYIKNPEADLEDQEKFNKIANLQIERKTTTGAFASSSGPSSRNVTYSRILE